jgi:hypothetical protein
MCEHGPAVQRIHSTRNDARLRRDVGVRSAPCAEESERGRNDGSS